MNRWDMGTAYSGRVPGAMTVTKVRPAIHFHQHSCSLEEAVMCRAVWLTIPVVAMSLTPGRGADPDVLDKAPSKFAKSGDHKVHYKSLGDGPTAVVFVHGWCCDHTVWRDQAAALNGKVRMLFIDLPGYGHSDKPKMDYTMDVFATGVDAVLRDAGVNKAVLAGHSMGTAVVRQVYRRSPDKVKALVFVDGALRPFSKDPAEIEKFASNFKEETFKDFAPQFLGRMLGTAPQAVRDRVETMVKNTSPQVAVSSMRGMLDQKLWTDDPVRAPALALMAKSPFWTDDYKAYVKKLVPNLDYQEFDGVGHFLFMEKPAEFNAALTEFLKKQGVTR
jgi:pimeloyl-ACP methyl ester carboxylesterase